MRDGRAWLHVLARSNATRFHKFIASAVERFELCGTVGFRVWWGWERVFQFVVPDGFWNAALANLVVVALPEELFYRGYLMGRIDHVAKQRLNLLGMKIGWSLIITILGTFIVMKGMAIDL